MSLLEGALTMLKQKLQTTTAKKVFIFWLKKIEKRHAYIIFIDQNTESEVSFKVEIKKDIF